MEHTSTLKTYFWYLTFGERNVVNIDSYLKDNARFYYQAFDIFEAGKLSQNIWGFLSIQDHPPASLQYLIKAMASLHCSSVKVISGLTEASLLAAGPPVSSRDDPLLCDEALLLCTVLSLHAR